MSEQPIVEFDAPQPLFRVIFEVEERALARTQEIRIELSDDTANSWRELRVHGATFQHEDIVLQATATHLRLTIVRNKSGSGAATLTPLQRFA